MDHTINPYKLTLVRVAHEGTEILPEVVVARGAGLGNQACRQLKVFLHVLELVNTGAQ